MTKEQADKLQLLTTDVIQMEVGASRSRHALAEYVKTLADTEPAKRKYTRKAAIEKSSESGA